MSIQPDSSFYENLPVFDDFARITDESRYRPLPDDWQVVVADVEGSTAAISKGLYKQVNIVGAASIMSVLNAVKPRKVPFVFGGDGALLAVPEPLIGAVRPALVATKLMAQREFRLSLRVGIVPVPAIRAAGLQVLVARYRVSEHYTQAVFTGGGAAFAEACVKDPERGRPYRIEPGDVAPAGRFDGLECRWDDIPSPLGETISLVALAVDPDPERRAAMYGDILREIRRLYGDADVCRPVRRDGLRLARSNRKLAAEVGVRTSGRGGLYRGLYWLRLMLEMGIGYLAFPRDLRFGGVDWGQYQRDVVANTDCRKFDDVLRLVLSGGPEQRQELSAILEERFRQGDLVYGLHTAPSALMTCLIFNRHGEHVHFVDGADGGYAMAALEMKERLKSR